MPQTAATAMQTFASVSRTNVVHRQCIVVAKSRSSCAASSLAAFGVAGSVPHRLGSTTMLQRRASPPAAEALSMLFVAGTECCRLCVCSSKALRTCASGASARQRLQQHIHSFWGGLSMRSTHWEAKAVSKPPRARLAIQSVRCRRAALLFFGKPVLQQYNRATVRTISVISLQCYTVHQCAVQQCSN